MEKKGHISMEFGEEPPSTKEHNKRVDMAREQLHCILRKKLAKAPDQDLREALVKILADLALKKLCDECEPKCCEEAAAAVLAEFCPQLDWGK